MILPGEKSCEQCGAVIQAVTAEQTGVSGELRVPDLPSGGFADTAADMNAFHTATPSSVSGPIQYTIDADEQPADVDAAPASEPAAIPTPVSAEAPVEPALVSEYVVEEPAPDAPAPTAAEIQALKQQRAALELEIKRQQDIINQLDVMRNTFREVTPQAVLMGISEAEQRLQVLRGDLDALPQPPEIDPQLIERLKKDMARQVEIIEQFEQIQQTFGAATPRAVIQGIADARAAVELIAADLLAYGVETVAPKIATPGLPAEPPVVVPTPVPPRPVAVPAEAPVAPPPPPAAQPLIVPVPTAPSVADLAVNAPPAVISPAALEAVTMAERPVGQVVNPVAPTARLQLESGTVLTLPTGRREIIIGRDDPISGVHPEVDMTPYGAESGGVSRRHVRLTVLDGQWMITDLQSTNHTRVNGVRIDPGVPTQLPDGAQVVLGRIGFIFRCS